MRTPFVILAALAAAIFSILELSARVTRLDDERGLALSGQVKSADDGAREGVLASVKADGSAFATTVVSDDQGRYRFPTGRLVPGHYTLRIRAVGYDLEVPAAVHVGANGTTANLMLRKAKNPGAQLTDAEWLASIPGTEDQKKQLLGCTNCHTLERTLRSTHDAEGFGQVLERMASYANQSFPLHPQMRVSAPNLVRRFGAGTGGAGSDEGR